MPGPTTAAAARELVALGRELFLRTRLDSAAVVLEAAATSAAQADDRLAESDALTWWAYTLWQAGELDEAERHAEAAVELKLRHDLPEAWRAYNVLGLVAWWESRNADALTYYESALYAADGDEEGEAAVSANRALVLFEFGDFEGARTGFEAMRSYGARMGERRLEGNALINLAMLDVEVGDPSAAVPRLERARRLHESIESLTGVEFAVGHLGTAYAAMGELGRAYATLDSALAMTRRHGMRAQEAQNLSQLAGLHAEAEDMRRALDLYAMARAINEELGLEDRVATDLREEAILLAALERYPEGRDRAGRAFEIHARVGAKLEAERDLLTLAELSHLAGERGAAATYLDQGRRMASEIAAPVARAEAALAAARIADGRGEAERVLQILEGAAEDVVGGDYATEWEAQSLRARALLALGHLREAEEAGRRAVEVTERVRGGLASAVLRTSYANARLETYATLVQAMLLSGREAEAFRVADAARGDGVWASRADDPDAQAPGEGGGGEGERILRRIASLMQSLELYLNDPSPEARSAAEEFGRRVSAARSEYERHLIRTAESTGGAAVERRSRSATLEEVHSLLAPDEALIEYFVAPDRLTIFAVARGGLVVEQQDISSDRIASRVRLARELLSGGRGSDQADRLLKGLYELLLGPLARRGILEEAKRLVLVPHEALTYLPFAALREPDSGRYLVERQGLAHAPSAADLVELRGRPPAAVSVRSSHVFAPFPDDLPASEVEARLVAAELGGMPTIGSGATEAALRAALTAGGIVHAATHGVMNPLNPMFSRVELHGDGPGSENDGRLEVHELTGLRIRADLVFLSGCETGVGSTWSTDFARGEDFATLARAFLLAGAGSVVASLWRLEDPAAAEFARRFYERLDSATPSEALAGAQRAMLADPSYGDPFYWAPYQVAGG